MIKIIPPIILLFSFFSISAIAEGTDGDSLIDSVDVEVSVLDRQTALALIDENGHADIPNIYTEIGYEAFYNSNLSSVSIPNSIITIGGGAFAWTNLEVLDIPDSVVTIHGHAFNDIRKKLQHITLPGSVTSIGQEAFKFVEGDIYLIDPLGNNVDIHDFPSNASVFACESRDGNYAPINCEEAFQGIPRTILDNPAALSLIDSNGNIIVPDTYTSIASTALHGANVTNVTLPNTIESIGYEAFFQSSLEQINLPSTLLNIGGGAFANTNISYIDIPEAITTIYAHTFQETKLSEVYIPSTVTKIEFKAFNNSNITALYLPNVDIELGNEAFNTVKELYVSKPVSDNFNLNAFHADLTITICDGTNTYLPYCPAEDLCPNINGISSVASDTSAQPDIEHLKFCVSFINDVPTLNFLIKASDNFSNTHSASLLFWPEDEDQTWVYPSRIDSTVPFTLSVPLHEQAISGTYTIRLLNINDNDGLEVRFNQGILETLGFDVSTELNNPNSDSIKPEVVSFSSDGWVFDDGGLPQLSASIVVTDEGSGVTGTRGILELISPTGKSIQSSAYVSDENTLEFSFFESKYTNSGTYTVNTIRLNDYAGNQQMSYDWLLSNPISFDLNNPNSDSLLSSLTEFKLSASFDNESDRPVINVSGTAVDDLSGVESVYLRLLRPEGGILDKWITSGSSGTSIDFENIIPLTTGFVPGTYSVGYIRLIDIAGNQVAFQESDLAALNADLDTEINVFFPDEVDVEQPNLEDYYSDDSDLDSSPATDSYVVASWASLFGQWPGTTQTELITLTFDGFSEAITSFPINFSDTSHAAGFQFMGIGCDIAAIPDGQCASPEDTAQTQSAYIANVEDDGSRKIVTIGYASDSAETTGLGLNIHFDSTQASLVDASIALQNAYVGGTAEKDYLFGTNASNDEISAGGGDDYIYTGDGDDIVNAGEGSDLIVGGSGLGDDTYNGGEGSDTVSYTSALSAITVDLIQNTATGIDIGQDQLSGIENIIAGQGNDTLILNEASNSVYGGLGDDQFINLSFAGTDELFGEDGNDTFSWSSAGVGHLTISGGAGADIFKPANAASLSSVILEDFAPDQGDLIDLSSYWANNNAALADLITDDNSLSDVLVLENSGLVFNKDSNNQETILTFSTNAPSITVNEWIDSDGDGVSDAQDSSPYPVSFYSDSDNDGIPDYWEQMYGLNPENPADATSDQDLDGKTALEEFNANSHASGTLDLDGDNSQFALTDGLLIMRYLFGLRDNVLIQDSIATTAIYTTAAEITARLELMRDFYDIDASGDLDALTDGLMILRYLFGLTNQALIENAVSDTANRSALADILAHMHSINPSDSDSDGVHDSFDLYPFDANEIGDHDGDSIGNNADTDDDNDGVADSEDVFPRDATETIDTDADGIGNNADTDDDNDGIADSSDAYATDPTKHKAQVWGESDWGKTNWKPNNSGFTWGESTWGE